METSSCKTHTTSSKNHLPFCLSLKRGVFASWFGFLYLALHLPSAAAEVCTGDQINNRLLALSKVQARLGASEKKAEQLQATALVPEISKIYEMVAARQYTLACEKVAILETKLKIDITEEQKTTLSMSDLRRDGGKGTGNCSIADAAKKQMALHGILQQEVAAGRLTQDIFSKFSEDTKSYGELLVSDPSAACALLDEVQAKYGLAGVKN